MGESTNIYIYIYIYMKFKDVNYSTTFIDYLNIVVKTCAEPADNRLS